MDWEASMVVDESVELVVACRLPTGRGELDRDAPMLGLTELDGEVDRAVMGVEEAEGLPGAGEAEAEGLPGMGEDDEEGIGTVLPLETQEHAWAW